MTISYIKKNINKGSSTDTRRIRVDGKVDVSRSYLKSNNSDRWNLDK